jgi:glycosyltransferase involved in cell wall biosynthesis
MLVFNIQMIEPQPPIAIVSTTVPPAVSGQARVIYHLIGTPMPREVVLLTEHWPFSQLAEAEGRDANYRKFKQLRIKLQENGWLEQLLPWLNSFGGLLAAFFERADEITAAVRECKSAAIIGCTGSPFDLPACTIAAFRTGVPFIVYLFDDPIFQWPPGRMRQFARLWEPIWSRVAAQVITPNEAMHEEFLRRRGRESVLIRNPVAAEAFVGLEHPWPSVEGRFRIVYTGSVYHAQADAFTDLVSALNELEQWSLHIYTSQSHEQLAAYGICGPKVFHHEHVGQFQSYLQQRSADVLFLPLAFGSEIQAALRTAAPMKLGEYLASGRPILVHAPADSFVVQHFRKHGAGVVVDRLGPHLLAAAASEIARNPLLRRSLRANALNLAELYKATLAHENFWNVVKRAVRRKPNREHDPTT